MSGLRSRSPLPFELDGRDLEDDLEVDGLASAPRPVFGFRFSVLGGGGVVAGKILGLGIGWVPSPSTIISG